MSSGVMHFASPPPSCGQHHKPSGRALQISGKDQVPPVREKQGQAPSVQIGFDLDQVIFPRNYHGSRLPSDSAN